MATLTIASKNYGSWSLRGWLLCKMAELDFEEQQARSDDPSTRAELLLLSPSFLASEFTAPEWAATFARDPTGAGHRLVPVRVRECVPTGLLAPIVYIDLVGLSSRDEAQTRLLDGLNRRLDTKLHINFGGRDFETFMLVVVRPCQSVSHLHLQRVALE